MFEVLVLEFQDVLILVLRTGGLQGLETDVKSRGCQAGRRGMVRAHFVMVKLWVSVEWELVSGDETAKRREGSSLGKGEEMLNLGWVAWLARVTETAGEHGSVTELEVAWVFVGIARVAV